MPNMIHPHVDIYTDEESKSTIGRHQLPRPLNFLLLNDDEVTSIVPEDTEISAYIS